MAINDQIKRDFIDNLKNKFNTIEFLKQEITLYFYKCFEKFKIENNINNMNEDNIFIFEVIDIRDKCGEKADKYTSAQSRSSLTGSLVNRAFGILGNTDENGQETKERNYNTTMYNQLFNIIYYEDFYFSLDILKHELFNKEIAQKFSKYYKEFLITLIPHLYKRLADKIMEILKINSNEYYVSYGKIFNMKEFKDLTNYMHGLQFNKLTNIQEPFLCINTSNIYNLQYNDKRRTDSHSVFTILPLKNEIYFGSRNTRSIAQINKNNTFSEFERKTVFIEKDKHKYLLSIEPELFDKDYYSKFNFETVIPDGYIANKYVIGNILNYLYITFINKNTKEKFILSYNKYGLKIAPIYSISSIKPISLFNKRNIEDIARSNEYVQYATYKNDKENKLTKAIDELEKFISNLSWQYYRIFINFLCEEYKKDTMVSSGLVGDYFYNEKKEMLIPYVSLNLTNYTNDLTVNKLYNIDKLKEFIEFNIQFLDIDSFINGIPYQTKFNISYMHDHYMNYTYMGDSNKILSKLQSIQTNFDMNFYLSISYPKSYFNCLSIYAIKNILNINDTIKEIFKYYGISILDKLNTNIQLCSRNELYKFFEENKLLNNNTKLYPEIIIMIMQYIMPLYSQLILNNLIPAINNFSKTNKNILECVELSSKIQSFSKILSNKKKDHYNNITLDDIENIENFCTEANYYAGNSDLNLSAIQLYKFYEE